MSEQTMQAVQQAFEMVHQANLQYLALWRREMLFTWRWWLLVALAAGSWLGWAALHDRQRTDRLLYGGLVAMLLFTWLDFLGVSFGAWLYPIDIFPTIPSFFTWDFCVGPVMVMLFMQYLPRSSVLIKAVTFAVLSAFGMEPLFQRLGLYVPVRWSHSYSFPIFVAIYLTAHWFSRRNRFAPWP